MVKVYVNDEWMAYVASFTGVTQDDPQYNPSLDINEDGVIDVKDLDYFAHKHGDWAELPEKLTLMDWWAKRPKMLGAGIGGILIKPEG